jgi:excisionase family DNA binding protein
MEISKHFFSRKETAKVLSISLPTLNRRLADGSIPHVKLGGRVLIPAEYINKLSTSAFANEERQ